MDYGTKNAQLNYNDYKKLYVNSVGFGLDTFGMLIRKDMISRDPKTIAGKCLRQMSEMDENEFKNDWGNSKLTQFSGFYTGFFVNVITGFVPALLLSGYNVLKNIDSKKGDKSIDEIVKD